MKNFLVNGLIVVFVLAAMFGFALYSDPAAMAAMETAKAEQPATAYASPATPSITQNDIDQYAPIVIYAVIGLLLISGINKVLHSELAIPFVTIVGGLAIVLFATYLFVYGDKDHDGAGDTQIIKAVQPVGQAGVDAQYAEINQVNTKSNFLTVVSITVYSAILLVAMVVVTGIGVVLHYSARAKGG
jgi:hypothetical protein